MAAPVVPPARYPMAVSYTHLRGMGKGGFFYLFFPFPVGRADAVDSFAEEGSYASAFCFIVFYGCSLAVSYTHLDVYKRQK